MRVCRFISAVTVALAVSATVLVWGQAAGSSDSGQQMRASLPEYIALDQLVREIDDPHTGNHWLLLSDPAHPGGPGRLVLVPRRVISGTTSAAVNLDRALQSLRPIIRAGDRIIVEENTAVVEARLEAVALGPAALGASFTARLTIGGRVVQAIAVAPGRADLLLEEEERR